MKIWISLFLILLSINAYSERIVLTGKAVNLILHRDYYTLPGSYRKHHSDIEYHFVSILATRRVCFLYEDPNLASLDMIQIFIEELGVKLKWNCYQYSPTFFEVDY